MSLRIVRLGSARAPEVEDLLAVIFEVVPREGQRDTYLQLAATLRPQLERIDGFISIERFQSLTEPDKLLSLSFWRDEEAIAHVDMPL